MKSNNHMTCLQFKRFLVEISSYDIHHEQIDYDNFAGRSDDLHEMFCDYQQKGHSASDFIEEVIIDGLRTYRDRHICEKSCWRADKML